MNLAVFHADAQMIPTIRLQGVSFQAADRRPIVYPLDLDVRPGEKLAIVGPNGAGKTTLLRLLFGRLKPSSGQVLIDGRDLAAMPFATRARCFAVVAQDDLPDRRLALADYVDLGRIPHRGRVAETRHREVVAAALRLVGLDDGLASQRIETLSGGERQRAAIARAIAQEPSVLILDEPTNHLDLRSRADMLELVRGLGITVVAVLHDLALVSLFAERVAVMNEGRLVADGPPDVALASNVVHEIFAMDCFSVTNPFSGQTLLIFDKPQFD